MAVLKHGQLFLYTDYNENNLWVSIFEHDKFRKDEEIMKMYYFTITGTKHRYGHEFLEPDMKVKLVKEPENEYDMEAIKVVIEGLGHIGYVANSPYTMIGESYSAGRLYDKIGDNVEAKVMFKLPNGVLGKVEVEE